MRSIQVYSTFSSFAITILCRPTSAFQQIIPFGVSLCQPGYNDLVSTSLASSAEVVSPTVSSTFLPDDNKVAEETTDTTTKRSALFHAATSEVQVTTIAPDTQNNEKIQLRVDRLKRSLVVSYVCIGTSMLIKYGGLSSIQASSIQGILASFIFTGQPTVAAALCGSFAGMSGQLTSLLDASILGFLGGISYYLFESKQKLAVGHGGRLGTIAFIANLVYNMIVNPSGFLSVVQTTVKTISPVVLVTILTTFAVYRNCFEKLKNTTSDNKEMLNYAQRSAQVVLLCLFVGRLLQNTPTTLTSLLATATSAFIASLASNKLPGVVLPVGIIGLIGSILAPTYAAPIYMGGFIGMTALKQYKETNFAIASLFSACLFHLSLLDGFGGRLGLFAFLGVNMGL